MAVPTETALESTFMGRLAALEKRFADLESNYNKLSSSKAGALASPSVAPGDVGPQDSINNAKVKGITDDKPVSRVKVVINNRNADGEPTETTEEQPQAKKEDPNDHAFVLRKIIYPKTARDYEPSSEIDIVSPKLWGLLKELLGWYPYHTFRESPVTLFSPFEAIVFDWEKLKAASGEVVEDQEDLQARKDLELLLDTISGGSCGDEQLDKYFKARDNNKSQKMVQFMDLWTIFSPGTLIYGKPFQDQDQVFIVKDNARPWPTKGEDEMTEYSPWSLYVWSYDWKDGSFGRTSFTVTINHFDGHVPVNSLPYFPLEHHEHRERIEVSLIQRGKQFQDICNSKGTSRLFEYAGDAIPEKKGFSGMQYDDNQTESEDFLMSQLRRTRSFRYGVRGWGTLPSAAKSHRVLSRVMVDYASYFQYGPDDGRNGSLAQSIERPECRCSDCQSNTDLMSRYRTRFDKTAQSKVWEDEQYLICPPRVLGYVLDEKQWAQLQVTLLSSIPEEDQTDAWNTRLQLGDQKTKSLLFDLVRSHTSPASSSDSEDGVLEVDDIVPGKGKGLVILLYGPPGVGKTSTAETIAVAARKPLFSVNVADVGTKAKNVEANLSKIFALATSWQAILLIDEADVFMESRGRGAALQSTEKNALVSVFLRVLEYYQGIMFLTTNQIAEFDIAIPSRIHIAIQYDKLNTEQMRKIFQGFLEKLHKGHLIHEYGDILEWLQEDVFSEQLDGRQIRNVVTTALNLARAEGRSGKGRGKLTKQHLKDSFNNVKLFKRDFAMQMQRYEDSQKLRMGR